MTATRDAAATRTTASRRTQAFLRRMTLATGGGMFIDGFIFASFAAALAGKGMNNALGVTTGWAQLISSSTLVGTFFGGLVLGYVTDRLGRRPMFTIDLSVFLTCSILMFFVTSNWQVLTLGLIMGLAIGADYSIGSPLLSEFTPSRRRGHFLGVLEIGWNVGYVVAFLIGYVINTNFPGAWHVTLAASAVPAVACLVIRHGLPESPRWLLSKGRSEEAEAILRDDLGVDRLGDFAREEKAETRWRVLLSPDYLLRTVFACTFWICIVLPYFALTFFQAEVLGDIGLGDNALAGALLGTVVALTGAVVGWRIVDRVGRRKILIGPMFVCGAFLLTVSFAAHLPVVLAAFCFFGYLFSYGIMSILPGIYPMEVFPTSVRTSGVGLASAASRVGAAIGTFGLPWVLAHWGLPPLMIIMAVVSVIGGLTSLRWAPETNGRELSETAHRDNTGSARASVPVEDLAA